MLLSTRCWQVHAAEPVVVLAKRGICTFVEKARNVQRLVAAAGRPDLAASDGDTEMQNGISDDGAGMVLLNGEDTLSDMPAGNLLTDDVTIPVAMYASGYRGLRILFFRDLVHGKHL